jgi:alpha-amylase/alpha-mannosidase (GH57 family)
MAGVKSDMVAFALCVGSWSMFFRDIDLARRFSFSLISLPGVNEKTK